MSDSYAIRLVDEGTTVSKGYQGGGFTKEEAERSVRDRNKRAEKLGVKGRYEFVPLSELGK